MCFEEFGTAKVRDESRSPFTGRDEPEFTWMHNTCGRNGAHGGNRPSGIDSPFAIFEEKNVFQPNLGTTHLPFFFG